jgi:polyhydroxybutyrate depolymerase
MNTFHSFSLRPLGLALALSFTLVACGGGSSDSSEPPPSEPPVSEPPTPAEAQDLSASLSSGGLTRTYLARVPAKSNSLDALPLVIVLHGGGGSGTSIRNVTKFDAVADANGFVVAYPDGYSNSWNDGNGASDAEDAGVDDVAFVSALIDDLALRSPIDLRRVYVTGISNGGKMSLRLACQLSGRIAAAAPVAANMPDLLTANCAPARAVPMMFVHGDLDPISLRAGGVLPFGDGSSVLSTTASVAFWNDRNGCSATPSSTTTIDTVMDGTSIAYTRYAPCTAGAENRFYDVIGGGHTWPGGVQYLPVSQIGRTSDDVNAGQEMWQFFRAFAL